MRVIIVDDEQLILKKHIRALSAYADVDIAGTFEDPLLALEFVRKFSMQVDVAFLDISMPEMSGIELAEEIGRIDSSIMVVFMTAYDQYAVNAFELNAIDYLLKPVSPERLKAAVERLQARLSERMRAVSGAAPLVEIRCFSKFRVMIDGLELNWGTKKTAEIFAYLLVNNDKAIHRDRLIDVIWPEGEYEKSVVLLQSTIYRLRKLLRAMGAQARIDTALSSYQLVLPKNVDCDLLQYRQFLADYKKTAGNCDRAGIVAEIRGLSKDGLMTDNDWDWKYEYEAAVEAEFERLTGEYLWVEE